MDKEDKYNKNSDSQEIDFIEIINIIWDGKIKIFIILLIVSILSIFYSLSLPNIYKSEATLTSVSEDASSLSSMAREIGGLGLANMAGISLGTEEGNKTTIGIAVLNSRQFFKNFANKHNVILPLMASNGWNRSSNSLIYDPDIYDIVEKKWVRKPSKIYNATPSVQESHKEFRKIFSVSEDQKTGIITISIEHFSPYLAKKWLEAIILEINELSRGEDILIAEKSISYLHEQIKSTTISEIKSRLFDLIQTQSQTIMLAKSTPEYLFKTIDPAVIPEIKYGPKRAVICLIGFLVGLFFAIIYVFISHYLRNYNNVSKNGS